MKKQMLGCVKSQMPYLATFIQIFAQPIPARRREMSLLMTRASGKRLGFHRYIRLIKLTEFLHWLGNLIDMILTNERIANAREEQAETS